MRLLVISDTHGYTDAARRVIIEKGPWDLIVHLGDSVLDAVELASDLGVDVTAIRGNNEYPGSPDTCDELIFEAGGVKFYAIHGHDDINPYAGDGRMEEALSEIAHRASRAGAGAALFGHTHKALVLERGGVVLVNPGGMGLGDQSKTYAEITSDGPGTISAEIKEEAAEY